jgi:hypothetical protein
MKIIKKQVSLDCVFYLNSFNTARCNMTQQNYHIMVFVLCMKKEKNTIVYITFSFLMIDLSMWNLEKAFKSKSSHESSSKRSGGRK